MIITNPLVSGVRDKASADALIKLSGADGIGIGQGVLGKPWMFEEVRSKTPSVRGHSVSRRGVMLEHAKLAEKLKGRQGII